MENSKFSRQFKLSWMRVMLCAFVLGFFALNADAQNYAIVNGNHVNVRQSPNTSSPVLFQLNKGVRVSINYNWSTVTGWTPIIYNGRYGYINNQFLLFKTGSTSTPSYQMATVTGDGVRVRSAPSLNASIIKKVNRGKRVALDRSRTWANGFVAVIVDGRTYGYIASEYLYW